ncbi:hypothetical protein AURDEDRAFT_166436 [Auricularia subglabra TFB-10046 SS5]|uniref:Uncharacterized protein n=1 Tax=Auricularia subglabra (strain TFB-10046 / SS5) TaxID=717982 RepID=J0DDX9_AURST|nr:hypothetical protein AURDEDRAFT_166436 [Auricularia subglabra TFB-10046 SS5]
MSPGSPGLASDRPILASLCPLGIAGGASWGRPVSRPHIGRTAVRLHVVLGPAVSIRAFVFEQATPGQRGIDDNMRTTEFTRALSGSRHPVHAGLLVAGGVLAGGREGGGGRLGQPPHRAAGRAVRRGREEDIDVLNLPELEHEEPPLRLYANVELMKHQKYAFKWRLAAKVEPFLRQAAKSVDSLVLYGSMSSVELYQLLVLNNVEILTIGKANSCSPRSSGVLADSFDPIRQLNLFPRLTELRIFSGTGRIDV